MHSRPFVLALVALTGCAFGHVRHLAVQPLGPYAGTRAARVTVRGPEPVANAVADSMAHALDAFGHFRPATPGERAYELDLDVSTRRQTLFAPIAEPLWNVGAALGLSALALGAGTLNVEGTLYAPEGAAVGEVQWECAGPPERLAPMGGREAGIALARTMQERHDDFVARRAGDERLFLTPTPLTLQAGEVVVGDDELLITHAGVGLGRRLQLDLHAGGLPVPAGASSFTLLPHLTAGSAVGGVLFAGVFDLGLKLRVLDEGELLPGLAVSYDMLDLFGAAVGAGGGVSFGDNVSAQAGIGGGAANFQFNVFSLSAGKHFGATAINAGAYLVDNHHFLPQSAAFAVDGLPGTPRGGATGTHDFSQLPLQVLPFGAVEHVLGPHSALAAEVFPRAPWWSSVGTTGVRWRLGFDRPVGPLALDRIKLTVDAAAVWSYLPTSSHGGLIAPLPYVSGALYLL